MIRVMSEQHSDSLSGWALNECFAAISSFETLSVRSCSWKSAWLRPPPRALANFAASMTLYGALILSSQPQISLVRLLYSLITFLILSLLPMSAQQWNVLKLTSSIIVQFSQNNKIYWSLFIKLWTAFKTHNALEMSDESAPKYDEWESDELRTYTWHKYNALRLQQLLLPNSTNYDATA